MSDLKHTPGPWGIFGLNVIDPKTKSTIAFCQTNCCTDENTANARLIAAAPELLDSVCKLSECLAECLDGYVRDDARQLIESARSNIAKATGAA